MVPGWNFSGKTAGVLVKVPAGEGHCLSQALPWKGGIRCPWGCGELSLQEQEEESALSWGWKLLASECPPCTRLAVWQKKAFSGPSSSVAEQLREDDLLRNSRNRALQLLNFSVSVSAACVFQGISTLRISCQWHKLAYSISLLSIRHSWYGQSVLSLYWYSWSCRLSFKDSFWVLRLFFLCALFSVLLICCLYLCYYFLNLEFNFLFLALMMSA